MSANALTVAEKQELAVAPHQNISLAAVAEKVMSGDLTPEKLGMLKELVAMDAKQQFSRAFIQLQSEIPKIKATRVVPDKQGNPKFSFAPLEDIDRDLRPLALRFGFTYSFGEIENPPQGRIGAVCIVRHTGGHENSNSYTVRIGNGPPGSSESQADGAAHTYAKRGALCDAFCIIVEKQDNDARNEGGVISKEYADELEHRLKMINGNVPQFLKLAGVDKFAEIPSLKAEVLEAFLQMKENPKR